MFLASVLLAQAASDQQLLSNNNPLYVAMGLVFLGLHSVDKLAFWYKTFKKATGDSGSDTSIKAISDAQTDLSRTAAALAKTLDQLSEYVQRNFEANSKELSAVREELARISERLSK